MKNKNIAHVFFDLDHTLWDFDKNSEVAFATIFEKNHPTVPMDLFIEKYIPINQACWKLYQNNKITHEVLRYNRLKHTFDALQYKVSDEEIDTIAEEYIQILPNSNHLLDGAIEILDYLNKSYKLHIITNGFAKVQDKKIRNSNLGHYFQTITDSEKAGVKKPNPMIYEFALNWAGAKKENSIMIGDCLDADVQGALDVGLEAIFYNNQNVKVSENITQINHLLELKKYL